MNDSAKEFTNIQVTCEDFIEVFKKALNDPALIQQAEEARGAGSKRSLPGELIIMDGWDVAKIQRTSKLLKLPKGGGRKPKLLGTSKKSKLNS